MMGVIRLTAGAWVAAVALALPAAAHAGFAFETESVGASTQGTAEVGCELGKKVIGGGYLATGAVGDVRFNSASLADGDDANDKPDDVYSATADNLGGTSVTVTAYAYCAKGKFTYRTKTGPPVSNGFNTVSKPCPKGQEVVGGGLATSGTFAQTWLNGSLPLVEEGNAAWFGSFTDVEPDPGTFTGTATVVCSKKWDVKLRASPSNPVAPDSFGGASRGCKNDETLIGGGTPPGGLEAFVRLSYPVSPVSWTSTIDNESDSAANVLTWVICRT